MYINFVETDIIIKKQIKEWNQWVDENFDALGKWYVI